MQTVSDAQLLRAQMGDKKRDGATIGFVPTMGFLHDGHLSLMKAARKKCDHLVVSIYVNPLQFGPTEDLDRYPSDPDGDAKKCRSMGVDTLFLPHNLYDTGHSTTVKVSGLTTGLCGASRPGHFDGVTTVVARLFGLVQPDIAVFGEKDYQQLAVIRRMTQDLGLPIQIDGGKLIRDHDGLALSSRNKYLNPRSRRRALTLYEALKTIQTATTPSASERIRLGMDVLDVDEIDYLSIVDPDSLEPMDEINGPARALVAASIDNTRLIDNIGI